MDRVRRGRQVEESGSVTGGVVLPIGDLPQDVSRPLWTADGSILFSSNSGMFTVPASGGAPRLLFRSAQVPSESVYGAPTLLPDNHTLLFAERATTATWNDARIVAHDLRTGARKTILDHGFSPQYLQTGHLVFARARSLLAVPFDPSHATVIGTPMPVLQGVVTNASPALGSGTVQAGIAASGTMAYLASTSGLQPSQLVWVDRNGGTRTVVPIVRRFEHPRLSPDGRWVVVDIRDGSNTDVRVGDLTRGTLERLTFDPREDESPIWDPGGMRIAFAGTRDAGRLTLLKAADGSGDEIQLFNHGQDTHHHLGSWSPDGRVIALTTAYGSGDMDILTLTVGDQPMLKPFVQTPFTEQAPMFSPDGKWIAYMSDESGLTEVYVQPFPGPGGKRQISTDGGDEPAWNRNGQELFYRIGNRMMVVPITLAPTFTAGLPHLVFEGRFKKIPWGERNYDVAPDGSRFLMVNAPEDNSRAELNVVLNWFEELKARVPTK